MVVGADNVVEIGDGDFRVVNFNEQVDNFTGASKDGRAHVLTNHEGGDFFPVAGKADTRAHFVQNVNAAPVVLVVVREHFFRRQAFAQIVHQRRESYHRLRIYFHNFVDDLHCVFVGVALGMKFHRLSFSLQPRDFRKRHRQQARRV